MMASLLEHTDGAEGGDAQFHLGVVLPHDAFVEEQGASIRAILEERGSDFSRVLVVVPILQGDIAVRG